MLATVRQQSSVKERDFLLTFLPDLCLSGFYKGSGIWEGRVWDLEPDVQSSLLAFLTLGKSPFLSLSFSIYKTLFSSYQHFCFMFTNSFSVKNRSLRKMI